MPKHPTPNHGDRGSSEAMPSTGSIVQALEGRLDVLAGQLRPLLAEYRAAEAALAAFRASQYPCPSGIGCRLDPEHYLEASRREVRDAKLKAQELLAAEGVVRPPRTASGEAGSGRSLRPTSLPALARDVLRAAGHPLHVDEIRERLAYGGVTTRRDSLITGLARLAATGFIFYRIDEEANTFGLREWLRLDVVKQPRRPRPDSKRG